MVIVEEERLGKPSATVGAQERKGREEQEEGKLVT